MFNMKKKKAKYFPNDSYTGVFIRPRTVTKLRTLGQLRHRSVATRTHNKVRINKKANAGLIELGDIVVLLAPEPLTFTSKWDPQWQVTRVSGTTVFLRQQQSGQTKKVHLSKVKRT